jgi:hypothetical protein
MTILKARPYLILCLALLTPVYCFAQQASADVQMGRGLLADNQCNGSCHQKIVKDENVLTLYTRSFRKVNSPDELHRQVELCISFLNAPVFPEDAALIVKALDHDAYHFE